jgi:hypothetical protein
LLAIALTTGADLSAASTLEEQVLTASQRQALQELKGDTLERVHLQIDLGKRQVVRAQMRVPAPLRLKNSAGRIAAWALKHYAHLLGGVPIGQLGKPLIKSSGSGLTTAVFAQHYKGLQVEDAVVRVTILQQEKLSQNHVVALDNRAVVGLKIDVPTVLKQGVSPNDAVDAVFRTQVGAAPFGDASVDTLETVISYMPEPRTDDLAARARVMYRITATGAPGVFRFWVDLLTGEVVKQLNMVQEYGRRVEVFEGNGTSDDYYWESAYVNESPDPLSSHWYDYDAYAGGFGVAWFDAEPGRQTLRDMPYHYHGLLEQYGHQGINSSTDHSYDLELGWNAVSVHNAFNIGDSGRVIFHPDWAVPDVTAHEMSHWALWVKDNPYPSDPGIPSAVHEGMGDSMGELLACEAYGECNWVSATGIPDDQVNLRRDLTRNPSEQECYASEYFLVLPNDMGVDQHECEVVDCTMWGDETAVLNCSDVEYLEYDPTRHHVCILGREHHFPCPHHIDYDADSHSGDLGPPDDHFCLDLLREEIPCPAELGHTFRGEAPTHRYFFQSHRWGMLVGRVNYLLWNSGAEDNNGMNVWGIGPDKFRALLLETMLSLMADEEGSFSPDNATEIQWADGDLEVVREYDDVSDSIRYSSAPGSWELGWSDICETMQQSCQRLSSARVEGINRFDCERVSKAWSSVGACDFDNDRVPNSMDNCPEVYNPDQEDSDSRLVTICEMSRNSDEIRCYFDRRGDGLGDACDLCPEEAGSEETGCYALGVDEPFLEVDPVIGMIIYEATQVVSDHRWVAVAHKDRLVMVERNANQSRVAGEFFVGQTIRQLLPVGNYLLVNTGATLTTLNLTRPAKPRVVGELQFDGKVQQAMVTTDERGRRMLLVLTGRKLYHYRLSSVTKPVLLKVTSLKHRGKALTEWDSHVFVAHESGVSAVSKSENQSEPFYLGILHIRQLETVGRDPVARTNNALLRLNLDNHGTLNVVSKVTIDPQAKVEFRQGQIIVDEGKMDGRFCGLGVELALVLAPLISRWRRRRSQRLHSRASEVVG